MWPHPILKATKDETRIYVFVGQREMLVRFMKQMKVEQLFSAGKYMVVYLFPDTTVHDELGFFLWNKEGELGCSSSRISSVQDLAKQLIVLCVPPRGGPIALRGDGGRAQAAGRF